MQPLYGAIIWCDCIINIFITFLMDKNDVTPSNVKETRTMGRMTDNVGN